MNLFTKQKQTCRHRKQTYGYQRGKEERDKFQYITIYNYIIYTLQYTKQTTNKDLLYSEGNYTKYFIMTSKGKEPGQ